MKEIVAIIRTNKTQKTKEALANAGFLAFTSNRVMGRGKQNGLRLEFTQPFVSKPINVERKESEVISFVPKRMFSLVVLDSDIEKVVQIIIQANQTGNIGDGKIFVSPVDEAIRIRTGDNGDWALI